MSFLLKGEITTPWGLCQKEMGLPIRETTEHFFLKFESTFRTRRVYNILITFPNIILQQPLHDFPQGYEKKSLKKKAVLQN